MCTPQLIDKKLLYYETMITIIKKFTRWEIETLAHNSKTAKISQNYLQKREQRPNNKKSWDSGMQKFAS